MNFFDPYSIYLHQLYYHHGVHKCKPLQTCFTWPFTQTPFRRVSAQSPSPADFSQCKRQEASWGKFLLKRGKISVSHCLWHSGDEHIMVLWTSEHVPTAAFLSLPLHPTHLHFTELHTGWGWQEPLEVTWTNPCSSRALWAGSQHDAQVGLKIYKVEPPAPLWAACAMAPAPIQHRNAAWCSEGASRVPVCAHGLWSCLWAPLERALLGPHCTLPSSIYVQVFMYIHKVPPVPLLL